MLTLKFFVFLDFLEVYIGCSLLTSFLFFDFLEVYIVYSLFTLKFFRFLEV